MASQYFAILTDYGTRAIAQALSQGQPLQLTKFAVGDGNGKAVTPTASATALVHQTHIAPVSAVSLDPRNNKQVIVELTIPENVGGFYIREMGVFDAQNKLIAYANCPESFKPTESSGSGKVQVLRMILKVESSSAVTLSIDNSVIFVTRQQMTPKTITATTQNGFDESGHSHEIAKASTTQQGIVQLTNNTGLESESLALTAKAGKKLAQQTAQLQLNVSQNYIPNSKKSSAVNSESEDNVATSKAAKIAYDKGIEAKTAADNAQHTANDGVSKADAAQRTANDGVSKANAAQTSANQAKSAADNAQRTANDANNNANNRVSKSGDTMTGNLTVPNLIVNDPTNNNNFVQIGDDTKLIDVDMGHTVGLQTTDNANDAYIAYGATKKRFGFDGVNFKAESGIAAQWYQSDAKGHGAFGAQWRDKTAPYVVSNPNANGSNAYFPFIKGFNTNGNLYGTAFSFGYMTPGHINQFGSGVIHLIEDNGNDKYWWFDHDGKLRAHDFEAQGKRLSKAHQLDDKYVDVASQDNYGGLRIRRPDGKFMIFEREGDKFKYWAQDLYEIYLPQKSGTLLIDSDINYQKIGNFGITKFPDGTMIQTYFFEQYDLSGFSEKSFNWAMSFTNNPVIIPKVRTSISTAHDCGLNILTKSNGSTCYYHEYESAPVDQGNVRIEFLAIGRWK